MKVLGEGRIEARRNKNTGKVTSYRIRHAIGFDPVAKKYQYTAWKSGFRTKGDARRGLEELRKEVEGGLRVDADDMTFAAFADLFHSERLATKAIADSTAEKDYYTIRHLKEQFGDLRLREITADDIVRAQIALNEQGASPNTIHAQHAKLKQILKEAVNRDYVMRNPCDKTKAPSQPQSQRKALTQRELARFTKRLEGYFTVGEGNSARRNRQLSGRPMDGYGMAVWVALGTGMRKSEILGLQWSCVNLDDAHIDVRQTLSKKGEVQQRAKSKKSIRRIPIDPETVRRLRAWRAVQAEYFVATIGRMPSSDSPVISNELCGFLDQHHFARWWREFCVHIGFARWLDDDGNEVPPQRYSKDGHPVDAEGKPYSRSNKKPPKQRHHYDGLHLHELRHTYATMLIANGTDFKTAQELLGHARASTTIDLYAHAQDAQKRAASDLIGSLLTAEVQSNVVSL